MYFHAVKSTAHPPFIGAFSHSTDCIVKKNNNTHLHLCKHVVSCWKRNSGLTQKLHLQTIKHTENLMFVTKWSPSGYHLGTIPDRLGTLLHHLVTLLDHSTRPFRDPTSGQQVDMKWPASVQQVVSKWSSSGQQVVSTWPSSGHQVVTN